MKQARTGLLVAIALLVVPAESMAQGKPKPKEAAAAPGAKPPAGGEAKPGDAKSAPGQPVEIDADQPPPGEPPKEDTPTGDVPKEEGGLEAICKLDPDACPNVDLAAAAKRPIKTQMYAVQQIYALRARRFEINPYWGVTMNDQFVSHPAIGMALNYYMTNVMAIGANFNWYGGLNSDSEFNANTRRAVRVGVPLNEYQWGANLNFTYVPMYGKFAGFGDFIFHWDAYVVGGVGAISTRPIVIFDPRYRNFSYEPKMDFNLGLGIRIFFNRWFTGIVELRDYIYPEKLENMQDVDMQTAEWRKNSGNWLGDTKWTNNFQLQAGISIFLPFSWEYRLPK